MFRWRRLAGACAVAAALALGCRKPSVPASRKAAARDPSPAVASNLPAYRALPLTPGDPGYGLTPAERAAVEQFLAGRTELRVATDADARPTDESNDMAKLYGIYHPYFVRGDVDDDGFLDFVLAFVDRTKPSSAAWFTVAVFRSNRHGGFLPAAEIERQVSLENGDIAIDRDSILISPDLAQDTGRRYRWNPRHGGFDFVSDSEGAPPDQQLSNRI